MIVTLGQAVKRVPIPGQLDGLGLWELSTAGQALNASSMLSDAELYVANICRTFQHRSSGVILHLANFAQSPRVETKGILKVTYTL